MARKKDTLTVDAQTGEVVDDQHLPGMEPPEIPAIERAAREVAALKEEAKVAKDRCDLATEVLIAAMQEHGVTHYRKHGVEVYLDTKLKVTVQITG